MNPNAANSNSLNDSARCQHHSRNGRCRLPVLNSSATLCAEHAPREQKKRDAAELSAILLADLTEFKSALPINTFLSRLLRLQAGKRISPRPAAVMAYTCNLLLRTLPAIEREINPHADDSPKIIIDMPRPDRD